MPTCLQLYKQLSLVIENHTAQVAQDTKTKSMLFKKIDVCEDAKSNNMMA